jgi:hypothetical protein
MQRSIRRSNAPPDAGVLNPTHENVFSFRHLQGKPQLVLKIRKSNLSKIGFRGRGEPHWPVAAKTKTTMCAALYKREPHASQRHESQQEIRGSVVEGFAISASTNKSEDSLHPNSSFQGASPLSPCHPDRSEAQWRDLQSSRKNESLTLQPPPGLDLGGCSLGAKPRDLQCALRLSQILPRKRSGGTIPSASTPIPNPVSKCLIAAVV